jgi:hypothetical protein
MRNVFLALFAALVLLLSACGTSPKATVCANNTTDCTDDGDTNTDNGNNGGDNGGTNGDNTNGDNTNGDNTGTTNNGNPGGNGGTGGTGGNPGTTPVPFDHSLMKGFAEGYEAFIKDYKGNQRLTVKALWIDQSNGNIITITQDDNQNGGNWIETNGEFGVRLQAPADSALADLPFISCGSVITTTVPANLSSVKGLIVPVLFVFDGDQVVGLILHGSYHIDAYGNIVPAAKLAMRVYSAADKVISKGECAGDLALDTMASLIDPGFGAALQQVTASTFPSTGLMQSMTSSQEPMSTASSTVNLKVDLGLKKGWNTVVLGADATGGSLELSLIDDTQPNFTWYFLSLADYIPEPDEPANPDCPEVVVPLNNTGEPTIPVECPVEEPVLE